MSLVTNNSLTKGKLPNFCEWIVIIAITSILILSSKHQQRISAWWVKKTEINSTTWSSRIDNWLNEVKSMPTEIMKWNNEDDLRYLPEMSLEWLNTRRNHRTCHNLEDLFHQMSRSEFRWWDGSHYSKTKIVEKAKMQDTFLFRTLYAAPTP